jgi:hypothetical protein
MRQSPLWSGLLVLSSTCAVLGGPLTALWTLPPDGLAGKSDAAAAADTSPWIPLDPTLYVIDGRGGGVDCATATMLTFEQIQGSGYHDSGNLPTSGDACSGRPYFSVWYRYDCTVSGSYTFDMCNSAGDTYLKIWTGATCCVTSPGSADEQCGGGDPRWTGNLTAGTTYWLECGMYSAAAVPGIYNFNATTTASVLTGACCLADGSCLVNSSAACAALYGAYQGDSTPCATAQCPPVPGVNCTHPIPITLPAALPPGGLPYITSSTTCGMLNDYANTCLATYDGGEDTLFLLNVTSPVEIALTLSPLSTTYSAMLLANLCPTDPNACLASSVNPYGTPHTIPCIPLDVGQYYLMVDTSPGPSCLPSFYLQIEDCSIPAACCLRDGSCTMLGVTACTSAGGTFQGLASSCDTAYCPQPQTGDYCGLPIAIDLRKETLPKTYSDHTCDRGDDYHNTCLGGYDSGADIVYLLTVPEPDARDLLFTLNPNGTTDTGLLLADTCPLDPNACRATATNAAGTAYSLPCTHLVPGNYFLIVDSGVSCIPNFQLTVADCSSPGACCLLDGTCVNVDQGECIALGGVYKGAGTTCSSGPCPPVHDGDNCVKPLKVTLSDLPTQPYVDPNQTTCGRRHDYSGTCLDNYNGEDIVYELTVPSAMCINIAVTGKAASDDYIGVALHPACPPPAGGCLATAYSGADTSVELNYLNLEAGTYYLLVSSRSLGDCINFDLSISACPPPPPNDVCATANMIVGLPYTDPNVAMALAGDDPNTLLSCGGCATTTAYGLWYRYLPGADCQATLTVTGADTITSLWTGGACDALQQFACSDLQTLTLPLTADVQYWILIAHYYCWPPTQPITFTLDCVPILGACCAASGVCQPQSPSLCAAAGGTFLGADTTCVPNLCPPGPCPGDGNCDSAINWRDIDYLIAAQNDNHSAWAALFPAAGPPALPTCALLNLDTNLDGHVNWRDIDPFIGLMNTTCAITAGACCSADGSCLVTTAAQCTGQFQGPGSACTPNPCPSPTGACCNTDGTCTVVTADACTGIFQGIATTCTPSPCTPPVCTGDGNCDLVVNWRDIDYLIAAQNDNYSAWSAMFPPPGPPCLMLNLDTSGDGAVNWRDIDPFIALMNLTCPHP